MTTVAPFGAWRSPLSAERVAAASLGLGCLAVDGDAIWWIEGRPAEQGRAVLVSWRPGTEHRDAIPPPWNARTRVHEYGGGSFAVADGIACFSHLPDQRVYRLDGAGEPRALTPPGPWRYADGVIDRRRGLLLAVGEEHRSSGEPRNCLVRIELEGRETPVVLADGCDFYAAPRLSPDGETLAWIAWRHPDMPWDRSELWIARIDGAGTLRDARLVAGGGDESVLEPRWSPGGALHYVSDRSGWWNLYRLEGAASAALCPIDAEFARPPWIFGGAHYDFLADGTILCAYARQARWHLGRLDRRGRLAPIDVPFCEIGHVRAAPGGAVFLGATTAEAAAVVYLDTQRDSCTVLRRAARSPLDPADVSPPEPIAFPSAGGRVAHGILHRPRNQRYEGPGGARPPLLVRCHGGPTSSASSALDLTVQFWTSRGFAFLDVDYAGSSGYGRDYRRLLDGSWGIADVEDCVAAARFAVAQGWVDPAALLVRGSSAGGFTALCALAFHDVFAAGASYYGIGDLEALHRETHKFESRYDEWLIGPYPERRDLY
ncbi:MAG TPA: prolyl oligopeptidase family serine peptidase, partial [Haliangiales bacterium]|nr:prolyl oligopeptidase family serine peptidase [Haliangiales bacterium]